MILEGKLNEIEIGDLILLVGNKKPHFVNPWSATPSLYYNLDRVGYVIDYTSTHVKMSNTQIMDDYGEIRSDVKLGILGFLYRRKKEKHFTLPLDLFESYKILEKYQDKIGRNYDK